MTKPVDVCVVGSGAGGGPIAWELSRAGASVVVLEKGTWHRARDFDRDELATVRRDYFVPFASDEPNLLQRGEQPPQKTTHGWIACCVGGGTVHMSGFVHRLDPGEMAEWPIGTEDLAPWYDKVDRVVGTSGPDAPLPPLRAHPMSRLIDRGAKTLGLDAFPTPRLILTEPRGRRSACAYCSRCGSYGCRTGARGSTLAALVPDAVATGRCEVRPHSMASEVVVENGRAAAVRYIDPAGRAQEQRARIVVLAASAIQTARLLLNSGAANSSGQVGRNLTFSTLAAGWGAWPVGKLASDMVAPGGTRHLQRSIRNRPRDGIINFLLPHENPIHTAERLSRRANPPLWGAALESAVSRYYREIREVEFEVFGRFLPTPGTRVTVDGAAKDRFGVPVARIHLDAHPDDRVASKRVAQTAVDVLKAAGAAETGLSAVGETTFVLQHGTCRMGADPKSSVLDRDCRSWDLPNLYVTDGSCLPSSGAAPTTLTILANSFRVAERIRRELQG